jgi:hypothetical protein
LKTESVSKLIVVVIVASIALFAWRKFTVAPPVVEAREVYPDEVLQGTAIDHTQLDRLLKTHVKGGLVDYPSLKKEIAALDEYLKTIAEVEPRDHPRDEVLAMYINAYNAATLRLILDYFPGIKSIKDIPSTKRWKSTRWRVAGRMVSLDDLEHNILRAEFDEPRIHFAVVCASIGCPILRNEAFDGKRIDSQLDEQVRLAHKDARYFQWDASTRTMRLTQVYKWFKGDFERGTSTLPAFIAKHTPPEIAAQINEHATSLIIAYLDWDWSLNQQ